MLVKRGTDGHQNVKDSRVLRLDCIPMPSKDSEKILFAHLLRTYVSQDSSEVPNDIKISALPFISDVLFPLNPCIKINPHK